jgi:hypothetical protein
MWGGPSGADGRASSEQQPPIGLKVGSSNFHTLQCLRAALLTIAATSCLDRLQDSRRRCGGRYRRLWLMERKRPWWRGQKERPAARELDHRISSIFEIILLVLAIALIVTVD